jgi:hypothetical protein
MEKTSMNFESNFQLNLTHPIEADQKTPPAQRFKLPHAVIVRAPGLLPMLYTLSELEAELGVPSQENHPDRETVSHLAQDEVSAGVPRTIDRLD